MFVCVFVVVWFCVCVGGVGGVVGGVGAKLNKCQQSLVQATLSLLPLHITWNTYMYLFVRTTQEAEKRRARAGAWSEAGHCFSATRDTHFTSTVWCCCETTPSCLRCFHKEWAEIGGLCCFFVILTKDTLMFNMSSTCVYHVFWCTFTY